MKFHFLFVFALMSNFYCRRFAVFFEYKLMAEMGYAMTATLSVKYLYVFIWHGRFRPAASGFSGLTCRPKNTAPAAMGAVCIIDWHTYRGPILSHCNLIFNFPGFYLPFSGWRVFFLWTSLSFDFIMPIKEMDKNRYRPWRALLWYWYWITLHGPGGKRGGSAVALDWHN